MTKTCRKCGTAFTEDLNTCPVCKTAIIQPAAENQVTASYAALKDQLELVSLKSRWIIVVTFILGGFLGLGWFYLGFQRRGLMHLGITALILILSLTVLSSETFLLFLGLMILQTVLALYYLFNPDAKDARGELLK
ncbi:MAG: hypothetical protein RL379_726 [Bacillota bacterium]|jgi:TM2 domain-containing membrane protein YozV